MKDKIILITGGTSGIGKSLVSNLYKNNTVIVCGRNQEKLDLCKNKFPSIEALQVDISNENDIKKLYDFIDQTSGKLDILINNAGIANFANLTGSNDAISFSDMEVNFKGTVSITTALLPLLKKSVEPIIIIVSSILAKIPFYNLPIYSAAKAALHSYCISLRAQLKNIRVVEVFPPLVDTPLVAEIKTDDKMTPEKVAITIINETLKGKKEIYPGIAKRLIL